MAEKEAVFVVLTAAGCDHCTIFKRDVLPSLAARLEQEGRVAVEKVEVSSVGNPVIPADKPAGLSTCTKFFPMLLLISKSAWDEGMRNRGTITNLRPIPFNIRIEGGQWNAIRSGQPGFYLRDMDGIMNWINDNLPKLRTANPPSARPPLVNNPPPPTAPIGMGRNSKKNNDTCNVIVKAPAYRRG